MTKLTIIVIAIIGFFIAGAFTLQTGVKNIQTGIERVEERTNQINSYLDIMDRGK